MTKKLFFIFFIISFIAYSQEITYKGFVQDSVQSPLPNANILAFPDSDDAETAFAITNEKGAYILRLQKGYTYQINISYIGYKKLVVSTTATEKTTKNFVLQEDVNTLDGVEVTYKIPIEVKEDTTVYDTDAFTNG
ncbi:MAG: carboxypeptidase-like regulatory domain-containing protein, partial [Cellulophaga sp.]